MSCQFKAYAKVDVEDVNRTPICSSLSGCVLKNAIVQPNNLKILVAGGAGEAYYDSSGLSSTTELSFLNNSCVSLSPSAKWDSHEEDDVKTKFKTTWTGNPCHNESEEISAVLCLPLVMPNKSSRPTHTSEQTDWTCIVVGFNSGHLRFYDEGGDLLLSEQIHNEPVCYVKCQSYHPAKNSSYDDYAEELHVTFCSTVAIIPGFALFQTLRACRNHLARVKANFSEHILPPPLTLKKWAFVDQGCVKDCEVIGPSSSDMFDHLMTASIVGGFNTCYRSGAPKSTVVVAAGKEPFIGFHHALEGFEGRSVLTDVAQVVKNKFKGFFGGSTHDRQKSTAVIEPAENLALRFSLFDPSREADHIVRSPNREYSVVSDGLGRLTLINNSRAIAVRMWKGYRRAQCGWLQVEEEEPSQKGKPKHLLRNVLFLVIYDPKKGMLEVWTVPNGVRVTAFSCSKKGRLLYTSHGLVGLNNAAVKWANKSLLPCAFIDPFGTIFQIIVPFHCALSDSTSDRAADLALLRKLKSILREDDLEDEQLAQEVGLLAAELKTEEVRKQMLAMLTSHKHVTIDALEAALAVFTDKAMSEASKRQMLLDSCQQLRNILEFFKFVQQQKERPPNYASVVPQEGVSDLQAVGDVLNVSEQELTTLKSLISLLDVPLSTNTTPRREARVTFNEGTLSGSSLVDYLACFDIGKMSEGNTAPNAVAIKKLSPSKLQVLAELLFQGILYSDVPVEVWQAEAACSGILPFNLLNLAINFWLHRNAGKALEVEMIRFSEIVKAICLLEEVNSCDLSSFWSSVRGELASSPQPFKALTAALSSKSPKKAQSIPKTKGAEESSSSNSNDFTSKESSSVTSCEDNIKVESRKSSAEWEDVSWDSVKWNLLIGRLEEIALLDQVLSQNPTDFCDQSTKNQLPCLPYVKPSISLLTILEKGKGTHY
ncbi:Rab3 GTPase-activating protein non-catalytic subunit [Frankliniella fusca]|uniref:Rab3 GTPase-activating protein non-catalytic subunit n=1 Tax=Frankliniella fusca TaxID=407009 RepID=A0AAE1GUP1_9NEOP|nr:Rab3 GTPase-activating protein non-catalytic subunit [Frankliniella fusca]